jgi:hypothetical protein
MRTTRKLVLLPVLTVASAALLLFASLGTSAVNVPVFADAEPSKVDGIESHALTINTWNETAGSNNKKGKAGGANGTPGCPIKR